jgi:hypothetical protein
MSPRLGRRSLVPASHGHPISQPQQLLLVLPSLYSPSTSTSTHIHPSLSHRTHNKRSYRYRYRYHSNHPHTPPFPPPHTTRTRAMATRPAPPVPSGRSRRDMSGSERASRPKPRIGQYIIERTLGTGSFGKVKRASLVQVKGMVTVSQSRGTSSTLDTPDGVVTDPNMDRL